MAFSCYCNLLLMLRMTQFWHVFSYLSFIFMIKYLSISNAIYPKKQNCWNSNLQIYKPQFHHKLYYMLLMYLLIFFHLYTERNNGGADFLIVNYIKAFHFRSCKLLTTSKTYSVLFRINKSSNEQMSLKYFQNICRHI